MNRIFTTSQSSGIPKRIFYFVLLTTGAHSTSSACSAIDIGYLLDSLTPSAVAADPREEEMFSLLSGTSIRLDVFFSADHVSVLDMKLTEGTLQHAIASHEYSGNAIITAGNNPLQTLSFAKEFQSALIPFYQRRRRRIQMRKLKLNE